MTVTASRGECGISPPVVARSPGRAAPPLGLYTIEVSISWRKGDSTRSVSLRSQRIGGNDQRSTDRSQSGFTLLELLIAVTILGLIVVALTDGVRFAGQAWETQDKRIARHGDLDAVQNVLRQLIAPAERLSGTSFSLQFVGAIPAALARGGLYDIELRALNSRLVLVWQPHFKGSAGTMQHSVTEPPKT